MQIIHSDALSALAGIPDASVDMVLTDPPYGTTACKWDTIIPFEPMWEQLKRVTKANGAIVLFGSQPFTSALVMSNVTMFKYSWVWDKVRPVGHLVAKKRPMSNHEDLCVFYRSAPSYYPLMTEKDRPETGWSLERSRTDICGGRTTGVAEICTRTHSYPKTIIRFGGCGNAERLHPTQKPVALCEYLIKTYTNAGETVLDFTMGSGTTGVACVKTGRKFIGIEKDNQYYEIARKRIADAQHETSLLGV